MTGPALSVPDPPAGHPHLPDCCTTGCSHVQRRPGAGLRRGAAGAASGRPDRARALATGPGRDRAAALAGQSASPPAQA